ncbi:MAG: HEAT repeat domain-containing protein, partial [Anaerolineae bacterium]|nr:HEAT repeat domain-containing protein [Anaerolineae bacterium]
NEMSGARAEKAHMLREWLTSDNGPQRVIITCRTADYDQTLDMGLPVVQIGDMDYSHIERFATTYLGDDLAQIFLAQILPKTSWEERHKQHLHQIARNPFLLSAMILTHKSSPHGEVPDNLGLLMHQLVSEIWEREHANPGTPNASFEELRTALADLAFAMLDSDLGIYVPYSYALENTGSELLLELAQKMQLIEIRASSVRFSQQMFQDYFAALALGRQSLSAYLHTPQIQTGGRYTAGKWDQAMIMYSGTTANTDEVLLEISRHNPFLALECISSGINASDRTVDPIIGSLIRIANTPESDARVATANILARIDENLAIPILLEAMRDGSWDVRWAATLTLQEIDITLLSGLTDVLWELEHDIQDAAEVAVRQLGPDALPTLLKLLQSDNWKMRRGAAWGLGRVQDRAALPGLVQALHDEDNLVSAEAATSLGQIKDEAGVTWLVETLQHANWRVRRAAAQALAMTGRPALSALTEALKNEHEDVRRLAIEALKEINDPDITEILLEASYDESAEVRGAAIDALSGTQDEIIVERLIECLADNTRTRWNRNRICDIAARVLAAIDMTEARNALEHWQKDEVQLAPRQKNITSKSSGSKSANRARERLQRITRPTAEAPASPQTLAQAQDKTNSQPQRDVVRPLKAELSPTAILHLARALENQEPRVRLAAIEALTTIGTSAALEILVQALRDNDPEVVKAATRG